jgi:KTSC domain
VRTIIEHPVDSSAISKIGYEEESRELFVRFRDGGAFTYLDVPPEEWLALCDADSKGAFVNQVIKPRYEVRDGAPI